MAEVQQSEQLNPLLLEAILAAYREQPMLRRLAAQSPLVPPEGLIGSPVMLVGEAPGKDEARLLRPFAGKAGAVLDRALKKAELIRQFTWITNTVLYRPPANRTPYPFEIACSRERLMQEIGLNSPDVIALMGAVAWQAFRELFPDGVTFQEALGTWCYWKLGDHEIRVITTWHPAATFHSQKALDEFDAQIAMIPDGMSSDSI